MDYWIFGDWMIFFSPENDPNPHLGVYLTVYLQTLTILFFLWLFILSKHFIRHHLFWQIKKESVQNRSLKLIRIVED